MAPLPQSNTERVKYTYQNSVAEHSIIFRVVTGTPIADVDEVMQLLLTHLGVNCMASTITAVERALLGSNIFNPAVGSTLLGDSFGSGAGSPTQNAESVGIVGRGSDGRRSRLFLFGYGAADNNFRITAAENVNVTTLINALNDPDVPLLTISGTAPTFNNYWNVNFNDHWVKEARG